MTTTSTISTLTTATLSDLHTLLDEYEDLGAMIDELEARREAIKDAFKAKMIEEGTDTLGDDVFSATWHVNTVKRFDSKTFKAEHADLYSEYQKASQETRFTLNRVKKAKKA